MQCSDSTAFHTLNWFTQLFSTTCVHICLVYINIVMLPSMRLFFFIALLSSSETFSFLKPPSWWSCHRKPFDFVEVLKHFVYTKEIMEQSQGKVCQWSHKNKSITQQDMVMENFFSFFVFGKRISSNHVTGWH